MKNERPTDGDFSREFDAFYTQTNGQTIGLTDDLSRIRISRICRTLHIRRYSADIRCIDFLSRDIRNSGLVDADALH